MKTQQIIEQRNKEYSKFETLCFLACFTFISALAIVCLWSVLIGFFVFLLAIGLFSASTAPYNRSQHLNSRLSAYDKWHY